MPDPLLVAGAAPIVSNVASSIWSSMTQGTGNPLLSMLKNDAIRRAWEKKAESEGKSLSEWVQEQEQWRNYLGDPRLSQFGIGGGTGFMSGVDPALVEANPDFQYWEPYTTQSDINASETLGGYEDIFMGEADRLSGIEQALLDAYLERVNAADSGAAFDEAAEGAARMGSVAGGLYFGGTAGEADTFQGQVQQALSSLGQTGFGTESGAVGNAFLNAGNRGRDLTIDRMTLTAPDLFRTLTQRDIGLLQNVGQQFTNYSGLRQGALESAFGAASTAAELPFVRSGERQNRAFFEEARPHILESLQTPSWLEQQGQGVFGDLIQRGGEAAGDWLFGDLIPGFFSRGGQDSTPSAIRDTYDYYGGTTRRPGHEPIPVGTRNPAGLYSRYAIPRRTVQYP